MSAELALGVADARDRAAALAHLEHCASCRRELRELSDLADAVGSLAPSAEPPAGFESRVLDRLPGAAPAPASVAHRPPRARPRARARWMAAAAAAVVAAGALGWAVGARTATHPTTAVSGRVVVAKLADDRRPVGDVVIQARPDPWISMAVSLGGGVQDVQCQLVTSDGGVITVGWFTLSDGQGYWAAPIPSSGRVSLAAAQVADDRGRVLAQAPLSGLELRASST